MAENVQEDPSPSYLHLPCTSAHVYKTVPDLFLEHVQNFPEKEAYIFWTKWYSSSSQRSTDTQLEGPHKEYGGFSRSSITFGALDSRARRLALGLLALGLGPGDRVAIYGRPSPEWMVVDVATLMLGVLLVRLPQSLMFSAGVGEGGLAGFLEKHRCQLLFLDLANTDDDVIEQVQKALPGSLERSLSNALGGGDPNLACPKLVIGMRTSPIQLGMTTLDDVVAVAEGTDSLEEINKIGKLMSPDDPAILFPTSGTTGVPKLVTHTHLSHVNVLVAVKPDAVHFSDRLFSWLGSTNLLPVITGCSYVHVDTAALPGSGVPELLRILTKENVTSAVFPSYLVFDAVQVLEDNSATWPPTLKTVSAGGEKLADELRKRFIEYAPAHLIGYGMTESGTVSVDYVTKEIFRPGESSRPMYILDGVEVKVTDPDDPRRLLPMGEQGILHIRSHKTMCGYLDDAANTSRALCPGGWLNTGDLGSLSLPRLVKVVGRVSDIISKGAVKILPMTVESVIRKHSQVNDVIAVAVPDAKYNNVVGACVIPEPGSDVSEADIVAFCQENMDKHMGVSLVPSYVEIMTEFPSLSTGKVDKLALKARLASRTEGKQ